MSIYAVASVAALALLAAVLAALEWEYGRAFEAYRMAHVALGQWESLTAQLPDFVCRAAEDRALRAVRGLDPTPYLELPSLFASALEEVRARSVLRLNYTASLEGDEFRWSVRLGRAAASGNVTWLRPLAMIRAIEAISSAEFVDGIDLGELVPEGFKLWGEVSGTLQRCGDGVYCGVLRGLYRMEQREPLRCLRGPLARDFSAEHPAVFHTHPGDNATYIWVHQHVYIER